MPSGGKTGMFGDRYFAMRARLADVMASVRSLADETRTDLGEGVDWQEIGRGLTSPFLFVVCGEVNSGKSTLLNALSGSPVCRVSALPETDRVLWYRHGDSAHDEEVAPLLYECHRPVDFLRDFHLVDTPGTNSAVRGHQAVTAKLLPLADLIMVVLPVANPWGSASWDFLSGLTPEMLERLVFVVQQADLREPADLDVIRGHIRDLSVKRIGRARPVFAVSGKLATEARRAGTRGPGTWGASGFAELCDYISREVCDSPERLRSLELSRQKAAAMLRKIEDRIEEQTSALARDGRFLDGLEREIDDLRGRFILRLTRHLAEVAETFQSEASWVAKRLHKRLASWRSIGRLFTGDNTLAGIEALFVERMEGAVGTVASRDGAEIVRICAAHWESMRPRVRDAVQTEMPDGSAIAELLDATRLRFERRIAHAARQGIDQLNVRGVLDRDLRRRNRMLMVFTAAGLMLVTAAGISGPMLRDWWWGPWGLIALAAACLVVGMVLGMVSRREIVRDFRQRLLDACGGFAATLRGDYEEGLRVVFKDYAGGLQLVRKHLAEEKLALEPRLRKWNGLFLVLKAIEQEL